jgi:phosphoribosyl 1,2-cyclic phosphodiesterase
LDSVTFLGSGGARFVVARQLRASGGMWFRFGATQIHVDPGPGALVRALSHAPPFNPRDLDGIALSHKHLDHSGDVTAMIEAMTSGGFRKRGILLSPEDALVHEATVLPYAQRFLERIDIVTERGGPYRVGDVEIRASIRHVHAVETYGMHFKHDDLRVSYLPCGRYFDALVEHYAQAQPDVLIINVLRFRDGMDVDHLTWDQARSVVEGVRPRVAIMQHFGTKMLEADPRALAQTLEDDLGIRAIAARDNLEVDLTTEVAAVGL